MSLVMNYTTESRLPEAIIDSNILIYNKDLNEPKKKNIAKKLFNEGAGGERDLAVTNQILSEFSRVLTEKMKIDENHVLNFLDKLIHESKMIILDSWHVNELSLALALQKKYKIPFWDAKLVATMISNNITIIYTENTKDFDKIPGIKAINPFA